MRRSLAIGSTIAMLGMSTLAAIAQDKAEAVDLGSEVKAAVVAGVIEREDARELYGMLAEFEKGGLDGEARIKEDADVDDLPVWTRLAVSFDPRPVVLLRPELGREDVRRLVTWAELDDALEPVVEVMVMDYLKAFEEARDRLRTALSSPELVASELSLLDDMVGDLGLPGGLVIAPEDLRDRVASMLGGRGGASEEDIDKTIAWVEPQVARLDRRIAKIRRTLSTGDGGTSMRNLDDDSLRALERLHGERRALRSAFERDLESLVAEEDAGSIAAAVDRIVVTRGRRDGRLGGDRIDPERTLASIDPSLDNRGARIRDLDELLARLADLVDRRTDAAIRVELIAAELAIARAAGDQAEAGRQVERLARAADTLLNTRIGVRDALLAWVDATAAAMAETTPETAQAFLDRARRDGFPEQMRARWCERALEAALAFEELEPERLAAIVTLDERVRLLLEAIRADAIVLRRNSEVEVGRIMADGLRDDYASAKGRDEDTWLAPATERFEAVDEETDRTLLAILGPELHARLPVRKSDKGSGDSAKSAARGKTTDAGSKGAGKGGGKSGGKGGGTSRGSKGGR